MAYYSIKREQRIKQGTDTISKLKELRRELPSAYIEKIDDIINDIYKMIN